MLTIADKTFASRLFLGTGKFSSSSLMAAAAKASGSELVTVALKRVELSASTADDMIAPLLKQNLNLLPNTSGARTAEEAILAAELSREAYLAKLAPQRAEAQASSPLTAFLFD